MVLQFLKINWVREILFWSHITILWIVLVDFLDLGNYLLVRLLEHVDEALVCQFGSYGIPHCTFAQLAKFNENQIINSGIWVGVAMCIGPMLLAFKIACVWKNQRIGAVKKDFDNCSKELKESRDEYMNLVQKHEQLRVLAEGAGLALPVPVAALANP